MRFDGKDQRSETYGILTHNKSLGLSKLSNLSGIIHFRHNTVNSEDQSKIIESELEITE